MGTLPGHTKILPSCFLMSQKLKFLTAVTFISTPPERDSGLNICLNVEHVCLWQVIECIKVWSLKKPDYSDVDFLGCSHKNQCILF
jgi:hypothetical protein